jgi:hypothetical protein
MSQLPQIVGGSSTGQRANALLPHAMSMWHRVLFAATRGDAEAIKVLHHVKHNRILLLARSQIGKTGSFIKLIELVLQDKYHPLE